ncbi:MAG: phosphatase PAP2 family protein [Prevotella sp.]|nr:phosphatase PAP2 family protein [Prevotella sp.]
MKKSLFVSMVMLFVGMTVNAQDYKKQSFIPEAAMPDAGIYLPAPPDTASYQFDYDFRQYWWGRKMREDKERAAQAKFDANFDVDSVLIGFAPSFGLLITPEKTPETYKLMCMIGIDGNHAVDRAKAKYMRKRPFAQFHEHTLQPQFEAELINNGSYPSGHTCRGWIFGLTLTELNPSRGNEIMKHAYEYGQSRVICGYHYQSDVDAGRLCASVGFAAVQSSDAFQKQMAKAKKEIAKVLTTNKH